MNKPRSRNAYLDAMGISQWRARPGMLTDFEITQEVIPDSFPPEPVVEQTTPPETVKNSWAQLRAQVNQCVKCDLHKTRTKTVFGIGESTAQWMIIGEAPGEEEDKLGEPFVGLAGQLLTDMLFSISLTRDDVFMTNILKCRTPNRRDPHVGEAEQCDNYLRQQIEFIQPKIILSIGRVSAQNLLKTNLAVEKLRGEVHRYGNTNIPVVVTYHPSYLIRTPRDKRKTWADLLFAKSIMKNMK